MRDATDAIPTHNSERARESPLVAHASLSPPTLAASQAGPFVTLAAEEKAQQELQDIPREWYVSRHTNAPLTVPTYRAHPYPELRPIIL